MKFFYLYFYYTDNLQALSIIIRNNIVYGRLKLRHNLLMQFTGGIHYLFLHYLFAT